MAASNNAKKTPLLVIAGPTASGKSDLAVELAVQLNGEVVSADSMQIYRRLDIATAKPTPQQMRGVAHHMIDILEPDETYSVADYNRDAAAAIADIAARGKTPIVCGGTGFYISTLSEGFRFLDQTVSGAVRERLNRAYESGQAESLYAELERLDSEYAKKIHPNDQKRIVRALEMFETTGKTPTAQARRARRFENPYAALLVVLECGERAALYRRIERRVDDMMGRGLLDEAAYVYENRARFLTAAQAIGYKEFFPYFEQAEPLESCVEKLKQATRRYAKRQVTWFSRARAALGLDIGETTPLERLETIKKEWNNGCFFGNIEVI